MTPHERTWPRTAVMFDHIVLKGRLHTPRYFSRRAAQEVRNDPRLPDGGNHRFQAEPWSGYLFRS
jgi:hypothetical protein